MRTPKIANFRHRVTIQSKTVGSVDAHGQRTKTWADLLDTYAEITTKSSNEAFLQMRNTPERKYQIVIRYVPGITSGMRVKHGLKYYPITACFDPDGRSKILVLESISDDSATDSGEVA